MKVCTYYTQGLQSLLFSWQAGTFSNMARGQKIARRGKSHTQSEDMNGPLEGRKLGNDASVSVPTTKALTEDSHTGQLGL